MLKLLSSPQMLLGPFIQPSRYRLHSFARASSSFTQTSPKMDSESYMFGPYKIDLKQVFYSTQLSYALVNLRPVVPAQKVGLQLESYHKASSLTFTIQDGPQSGQTVPHVHIHILPRKRGDFEKNDEIYDAIKEKEKELKQKLDLDEERKDRTIEEMAEEAANYRKLFT
ncbi:bifunctional bis(5'-adenosyl)-triphosphatase/adenylylsulfatase FHIT-like isoform X1 [Olea europaea var. sylvestris]|uniref:bifunctional bis(5'-adenosyl)-triphosphatase/adenylylsulfatase FHIT-like isoform X1 n=2 Tax=Olea europaea var. sylvestris TaxID=158386 RepID=UPI000C1CF668|nr:bifunctional bis(5'-adenosyl)-triphosphatase/adenylylsulfatase FHIT-like isoform X1 [Olea europaea var. sylvestris]